MKRLLLLLLLLLAACGHDEPPKLPAMLFSPNGEPLNGGKLGRPSCAAALGSWFDRTDRDHDGTISHAEFMADAAAQFARMDLDHTGVLTPEELTRYRLPFLERGRNNGKELMALDDTTPDPVMSADTLLTNTVTRPQFMAQAEETFARLDAGRDGRLTRAAVIATCPEAS